MLAQSNTHDTATDHVPSKSPLLSLPAEIRNDIYHYLMISHCGLIFIDPNTIPVLKDDDSENWKVSIDTPLLRTCHQVYQEASTIMYGENFFLCFCSNTYNPFNSPMPNFKLLQNLKIIIDVSYKKPSVDNISAFLSTLVVQQCSFKNLTLRYNVAPHGEEDFLTPTFGEGTELLDPTCAIDVQCQLEMGFQRWGLDEATATLLRGHIVAVAARKPWIATETYEREYSPKYRSDPNYEIRYLLRPGQATLSNTP